MTLVEGISNEVLFAFLVTILSIALAIYYTFSGATRPPRQNVDGPINVENVDGNLSEARNNAAPSQSKTNTNNTRGSAVNLVGQPPDPRDSAEQTLQPEQNPGAGEDSVRRRVVNDPDQTQGQTTGGQSGQDETMVVKVKHNENMQTFNVSKSITVLELKRLAFINELNAGHRVRFVYAGQLLRNDDYPLTRYGVLPNTVIHCVISDSPEQPTPAAAEHYDEDLDLSRFLIPLLTLALIMAWYGLISYKHIFTGSSIAILMFLTSLYMILIYVTTIQ
ncbi:transmembrane and ubiquitin-like domain-containing protein 1 [Dendronephthya gigantea]|uniref:transmembrane and ubiquitin-like domain-containing protein 1 n=1 Tax=Dendronephthya gigantea TaxID=151771 RepID=UPI001069F9CC|nr:transmembrane and ubiquitin-like domain-containing protein 1 [Dendronephthya gigantea]